MEGSGNNRMLQMLGLDDGLFEGFRQGTREAAQAFNWHMDRLFVAMCDVRNAIDAMDAREEIFALNADIVDGDSDIVVPQRDGFQHVVTGLSVVHTAPCDVYVYAGMEAAHGFRYRLNCPAGVDATATPGAIELPIPHHQDVIVRPDGADITIVVMGKMFEVELDTEH